jgi:hypothetical protein
MKMKLEKNGIQQPSWTYTQKKQAATNPGTSRVLKVLPTRSSTEIGRITLAK